MKPAAVAPPRAAMPGVSLLHFYRDVLDRLALFRLTACDPLVEDVAREVSDDLLSNCAKLTRQLQCAGLLPSPAKVVRLPSFNNPGNNRPEPGV